MRIRYFAPALIALPLAASPALAGICDSPESFTGSKEGLLGRISQALGLSGAQPAEVRQDSASRPRRRTETRVLDPTEDRHVSPYANLGILDPLTPEPGATEPAVEVPDFSDIVANAKSEASSVANEVREEERQLAATRAEAARRRADALAEATRQSRSTGAGALSGGCSDAEINSDLAALDQEARRRASQGGAGTAVLAAEFFSTNALSVYRRCNRPQDAQQITEHEKVIQWAKATKAQLGMD